MPKQLEQQQLAGNRLGGEPSTIRARVDLAETLTHYRDEPGRGDGEMTRAEETPSVK